MYDRVVTGARLNEVLVTGGILCCPEIACAVVTIGAIFSALDIIGATLCGAVVTGEPISQICLATLRDSN